MSNTIHKFELVVGGNTLKLPADAKILTVGDQNHKIVLWVLLDMRTAKIEDRIDRHFLVVGTGWLFDANGTRYIGTVLNRATGLVWHAFERLG